MAYTKSSNLITNSDATPVVMNDIGVAGGRIRVCADSFESGALTTGDTVALCRLPVNARVYSILIWNDDLGTTVPADLGIYATDATVKDADAFAAAYALGTANADDEGIELRFENGGANGIDSMQNKLWELAGDSSNPGGHYDIAFTCGTVSGGATGTISFQVLYTVD